MTIAEPLTSLPSTPELTPAAELALLARALHREGYNDHKAGHITYRQPDDTFLATPVEVGWADVRTSDIIRIDIDGNKLDGPGGVPPAIGLHLEYHRAQPGCRVTLHQHPQYTTIWSTAGRLPPVFDQRSAMLPDADYTLYDDFAGILEGDGPVLAAVAGIGTAKCTLLRNHGAFVIGDSIAQAFTNATTLEWRCRVAWFADLLGSTGTVPDYGRTSIEESIQRHGGVSPGSWEWAVRRELGRFAHVLD